MTGSGSAASARSIWQMASTSMACVSGDSATASGMWRSVSW
ncbi:hypothetical protein [Comamonas sp. JC664]